MKVKANLFRTLGVLAVVLVALIGVDPRTAETQTTPTYYKVEDLGTLGGSHSWPSAINDSGEVVGSSYLAGDQNHHAFLYKDGKMTDLGTLGGTSSVAKGINKSGQVVGYSDTESGEWHSFLYDESANPKMQDLNDLIPADLGWTINGATAINSDGKIAAYGDKYPPYGYLYGWLSAFVLTPATTATPATYEVQDLGTLLEADPLYNANSYATGINDSGQVVGTARYACSQQSLTCENERAFLYDEGATQKMQDLGFLRAAGINDSGQVVGSYFQWVSSTYSYTHALLYDDGTMQNLGSLGGNHSEAIGINDPGKVVGSSDTSDGERHAFLKERAQPMIDLNTLIPADSGWTISSASAINNDGQIAATGYKDGVGQHALLLTPTSSDIPPPADIEAPSPPTITSPQNDSYDTDGSFSVSGNAEASSTVELFEGTTSKGTTKADSSSGAWSIALSGVSEGAHTYTAKATDAAGNTSSASHSVIVTVDKSAPTVSKMSPASGATAVARNTSVTAQFSEDVDGTTLKVDTFMLGKGKLSSSQLTSATRIASQTTVSYEPTTQTATLDPYGSTTTTTLVKCQWYTTKLTSKVKDKAGNPAIQKLWQFKTLC